MKCEPLESFACQSARMREIPGALAALASQQCGVLSRRQLDSYGFTRHHVATRIAHGFWQEVTPRVIAINTMPLTRKQQLWAAVLHFETAALTGVAALEFDGLKPERTMRIDVLTHRGGKASAHELWRIHSMRNLPTSVLGSPRRTTRPLSVLHAMAWAASNRQAVFYATWAIQQRLVTLDSLQKALETLPSSPTSKSARRRLRLVVPGAMSILEHDFVQLCVKFGLPQPQLQVPRRDAQGKQRFLDAVFENAGRRVIVEIDGLGHLDAEVFVEDQFRANEITRANEVLLRIPGIALRVEAERFMNQLRRSLGLAPVNANRLAG